MRPLRKRKPVMVSMDRELHERGKKAAGLIPFSRWIESLIKRELELEESGTQLEGEK